MDNYSKETENNLIEMMKLKEQSDKRLLSMEWVVVILSLIVLFVPIIIGAALPMEEKQRMIIIFSGFVPCLAGLFAAIKIEQVAGYYECRECGNRYVPTYLAVSLAQHLGRTRYMKCPNCGKKSWQKKVISKKV